MLFSFKIAESKDSTHIQRAQCALSARTGNFYLGSLEQHCARPIWEYSMNAAAATRTAAQKLDAVAILPLPIYSIGKLLWYIASAGMVNPFWQYDAKRKGPARLCAEVLPCLKRGKVVRVNKGHYHIDSGTKWGLYHRNFNDVYLTREEAEAWAFSAKGRKSFMPEKPVTTAKQFEAIIGKPVGGKVIEPIYPIGTTVWYTQCYKPGHTDHAIKHGRPTIAKGKIMEIDMPSYNFVEGFNFTPWPTWTANVDRGTLETFARNNMAKVCDGYLAMSEFRKFQEREGHDELCVSGIHDSANVKSNEFMLQVLHALNHKPAELS